MKATWYETAGAAREVLRQGQVPEPEPGPGEVRVRVLRSAVNPTDVKRRARGRELHLFPRIVPGNDGAGVIDRVGEGVASGRVGESVWLFGAQAQRPFGTSAELCVVPQHQAVTLPAGAGPEVGACLGVPAVTAWCGVFMDGPVEGRTVLITGATGRVGRYAVQFARRGGATVVATAGSDEKVRAALALGAHHAINYRTADLAAEVARLTGPVDRVVEVAFGANLAMAPALVKANGVIAGYASDAQPAPVLPFYELMYANIALRPYSIYGLPVQLRLRAFADITAALAEGALAHHLGPLFDADQVAAAHEAVEQGADGVVQIAMHG